RLDGVKVVADEDATGLAGRREEQAAEDGTGAEPQPAAPGRARGVVGRLGGRLHPPPSAGIAPVCRRGSRPRAGGIMPQAARSGWADLRWSRVTERPAPPATPELPARSPLPAGPASSARRGWTGTTR